MILLTAAGVDKLQLVTDSAVPVDVHVLYSETGVGGIIRANVAITTATTTDIVGVPSAAFRTVKFLNISNKHASASVTVTLFYNQNGTAFQLYKATLAPGGTLRHEQYVPYSYIAPSIASTLFKVLAADVTGQNIATAQPWFPSGGAVAVAANTTYAIDGALHITRAAGTTSHTTGIGFGGTATLTGIEWFGQCGVGDVATLTASNLIVATNATNLQVKAASVVATEVIKLAIQGIVRVNAAGTFIPQFTYSAIPGGVPTIKANSYLRLTPLGDGAIVQQGAWT